MPKTKIIINELNKPTSKSINRLNEYLFRTARNSTHEKMKEPRSK